MDRERRSASVCATRDGMRRLLKLATSGGGEISAPDFALLKAVVDYALESAKQSDDFPLAVRPVSKPVERAEIQIGGLFFYEAI